MTTFLSLVTRALHDDFATAKFGTLARGFINDAIGRIYRTTNLARGDYTPAAITVNAGDLGVSVTDRGLRIHTILFTDTGDPLTERPIDELAALQQAPNATRGRPDRYAIVGTGATTEGFDVVFWPTPDKAYTLQILGRFAPVRLAADGDVVPLPEDYEQLPVYWARSELFGLDDDPDMAGFWRSKFDDGLNELRADLQRRSRRHRRVPSSWTFHPSPSFRIPR